MPTNINMPDTLPRRFLARVVAAWLLLILAYFYLNNSLVHQWRQPVLIYPEADNTYWLLHILNIPQSIMQSWWLSLLFDVVLVGATVFFFIFPDVVIYPILSVICFWLFQIMFGSSNGHHYGHIGFLITPIPFIFRNQVKFTLCWQLCRYWILFLFFSAGAYKLYYGGFFYEQHMALILQPQVLNPDSLRTRFITFLVNHAVLAQLFYQAAAVLELACIIGFFTRKYDLLLAGILLTFCLGNLLIMQIPFWENSLILIPLLPWKRIHQNVKAFIFKNPAFSKKGYI